MAQAVSRGSHSCRFESCPLYHIMKKLFTLSAITIVVLCLGNCTRTKCVKSHVITYKYHDPITSSKMVKKICICDSLEVVK